MTDQALSLAGDTVKEIEALIVRMFSEGQKFLDWQKFLDLTKQLDDLWAELDVSCWTLGMLSPWAPQERNGEPTLAQLAGDLLPFTPESKPDLWKWPTLLASIDFLEKQQIIGRDQWNGTVQQAASEARAQPIAIRFESQVDDFRRHLQDGLAAGDSVAQFKNRIKDTVDSTAATVERNFRTSSKRAFLDGVGTVTRTKRFPFVKYVATQDNRTRPEHRAMDGRILEVGTPEHQKAIDLQREYNCILPGNEIEGEFLAAVRSHYDGQAFEVVTKSGAVFRVTKNHPVLTENGFVPARSLKQGDKLFKHERHREVVADSLSVALLSGRATEVDHEPTLAEQVFDTLAALGHHEHARAVTGNLHGDAIPDGEIDVVWSDARLLIDSEASAAQCVRNIVLELPLEGGVGANDLSGPEVLAHSGPLHALRFGSTSQFDAALLQPQVDRRAGYSEPLGQAVGGLASDVAGHDLADGKILSPSASGAPQSSHPSADGFGLAAKLLTHLEDSEAALVSVDEVLSVTEIQYSGHAYDFQTMSGLILTHSIALGNCRCSMIPLTDKQAEREGIKNPELNIEFDKAEEGKLVSEAGFHGKVVSRKGVIYKLPRDAGAIREEEVRIQQVASSTGVAPKVYAVDRKEGKIAAVAMENVRKTKPVIVSEVETEGVFHGTKPLQAVLELNERGIAHQDLHEGNVRWQPGTGKAVILDYGGAVEDLAAAELEAGQWLNNFLGTAPRDTAPQKQAVEELAELIEAAGGGWRLPRFEMARARTLLEAWNR